MAQSDSFYTALLPKITDVLTRLGTNYEIRSRGAFDVDSLTITYSGDTAVSKGVLMNQNVASVLGDTTVNSSLDSKTLILSVDNEVTPEHEVKVADRWYPMDALITIKPANITVLYIVELSL